MPRFRRFVGLALALRAGSAFTQTPPDHGTLVIAVGQEATLPVPTVLSGKANQDVADLLFLRLMRLGPNRVTSGDQGFVPELARSVTRRDSLTLVFELDPRARWHDGTPVTARDVVFTFSRARDPAIDPQRALLVRYLETVTAEGDGRVVFRFSRAYAEQLYDAVWHLQPLPAHLVDTIPAAGLAASSYARRPVGNGPYRWVARLPAQRLELAAVPDFFLGAPKLDRVVFLLARDPEAQLNLILDGTADALETVAPPANVARVAARGGYRILTVPTFSVGYLLFNQRAYGDRTRPHPLLADRALRRALAAALDRDAMVRAGFGPFGDVAEGPVARLHWIREPGARAVRHDLAAAAQALDRLGWRDTDGDGIRDRDGVPLSLRLNFPGTSAVRASLAAQAQAQWRSLGVRVELVRLDGPVWAERRNRGEFDLDFSSAVLDPSPAGLVQSWSCSGRGGSNVAGYCSPRVDSLLERALVERRDPKRLWQAAVRAINDDAAAVFLYAPANATVVHGRYAGVVIRPEAWWSAVWQWRVTPGRQLARDRAAR